VIAHIVLFQPKTTVTVDQKRSFARLLGEISRSVGSIKRAYVGRSTNTDPGYDRSFGETTYRFAAVLEFDDEAGLLEYLNHPTHRALGALFWEICEATAIVEVEALRLGDDDLSGFLA
jgi:hypothetical protein